MNMLQGKNRVNAIVRLGGRIVEFVFLKIEQVYGDHHHFTLQLDYDAVGSSFMHEPTRQMEYMGRFVIIDIQHGDDNGGAYVFKGVVTKVSMTGKDGKKGYLVIEGSSPTIMLESGRRMDVYSDMNLRNIFKKAISGVFSDYMKCLVEPTFENKIDFVMQYNETDWEFLKRIAYLYGENLFYSGSEILFGAYEEWEAIKLTYDVEISDIEFCSHMIPNSYIGYQYDSEQDTVLERQSVDRIENSNAYLDKMEEYNQMITMDKPAKNQIGAPVYTGSEMAEMNKRYKARTASQSVYIKGKSKTYESTIGRLITLCIPEGFASTKQLGTYRVVKSIHTIEQNGIYHNEFEAVPASLTTMPVAEPKMPVAESVIGKVTSHEDPKGQGRIQVDFGFANQYSRLWMRVMTPNAGVGEDQSKNRGMVFVPEKGDQVMVGFEYGDPNRPYVMGSMYHSKNGQGGGENNHLKSIITRQGHTIEFDDSDESLSITIKDRNGNSIFLDTRGENIVITAPETITMKAKNIAIEADENIMSHAGRTISSNADKDIKFLASENYQATATNMYTQISEDSMHTSNKYLVSGKQVRIDSTTENLELASNNQVDVQSAKKVKLF